MPIPTACPLCRSTVYKQSVVSCHVYGDDEGRAIFRCENCDVRYLYPGISAEREKELYAKEFQSYMAKRSDGNYDASNERERIRRMVHLSGLIKGRVLEIGCGSGFMLYPLNQSDNECVAVEPSGIFSNEIRSRGIECHESLDQVTGKFDLILHYYVMEHIADPIGFLRKQMELLVDGGSIVFEVPHVNDALTALYKIPEYDRFIWQIAHRWYFSVNSLYHVLYRVSNGPSVVKIDQRYDLSNHLIWARDGKPGGMGKFSSVLGDVEEQYKRRLMDMHMGDTLVGIIRK